MATAQELDSIRKKARLAAGVLRGATVPGALAAATTYGAKKLGEGAAMAMGTGVPQAFAQGAFGVEPSPPATPSLGGRRAPADALTILPMMKPLIPTAEAPAIPVSEVVPASAEPQRLNVLGQPAVETYGSGQGDFAGMNSAQIDEYWNKRGAAADSRMAQADAQALLRNSLAEPGDSIGTMIAKRANRKAAEAQLGLGAKASETALEADLKRQELGVTQQANIAKIMGDQAALNQQLLLGAPGAQKASLEAQGLAEQQRLGAGITDPFERAAFFGGARPPDRKLEFPLGLQPMPGGDGPPTAVAVDPYGAGRAFNIPITPAAQTATKEQFAADVARIGSRELVLQEYRKRNITPPKE